MAGRVRRPASTSWLEVRVARGLTLGVSLTTALPAWMLCQHSSWPLQPGVVMPEDESVEETVIFDVTEPALEDSEWESERDVVEAPAEANSVADPDEIVFEESRHGSLEGVKNCHKRHAKLAGQVASRFVKEKTQVMGRAPIRSGQTGYTY